MKPKQILAGVALLSAVVPALAADVTTISWQFGTADNPVEVTPPPASNPSGATGTLEINDGTGTGYWSGTMLDDATYGTPTGVWDILNGSIDVSIDRIPGGEADYTLKLTQFVSLPGGFPFALPVSFSLPGSTLVSQTLIENTSIGQWVESTYAWQNLTGLDGLSLTISSDPGKGLLLDSLAIEVSGILVPIPEPTVAQLGALGVLGLGLLSGRRSNRHSA